VEDSHVRGIGPALVELQIIRRRIDAEYAAVFLGAFEELVALERRLMLLRTDVSPDQAAGFACREGGRLQPRLEAIVAMVGRLLHRAVGAEFPTVIETADAVILDAAEPQRCPSMHAEFLEQPHLAAAVAERNVALAEERQPQRRPIRTGQLRRSAHRQPIAAHRSAHRRSRPDAGEQLILGS
jgi:hypothetical protein